MEGLPEEKKGDASLQEVRELQTAINLTLEKVARGEATLPEAISLLNDIQRIQYNLLKERHPALYPKEYDEVALASLTTELAPYTHLLDGHPVREGVLEQVVQAAEFVAWLTIMRNSFPTAELPEKGTPSDVFKATLRHILKTYSASLSAETIAKIELYYILKPNITPGDFSDAQDLIVQDLAP